MTQRSPFPESLIYEQYASIRATAMKRKNKYKSSTLAVFLEGYAINLRLNCWTFADKRGSFTHTLKIKMKGHHKKALVDISI